MRILVTRPSPAAEELVSRLWNYGQVAWAFPLIEFTYGKQLNILSERLSELQTGDMVFVLSKQVVQYANHALLQNGLTWPTRPNYYAIGRRTALALHTISGHQVAWPHEQATSEILIQLPSLQKNIAGKRALILRGNGGRGLLAKTLLARGAQVNFIECYQRCAKHYHSVEEGKRLRNLKVDTLIVTSGEILQYLYTLFSDIDRDEWLLRCRLIVVSERLATLARSLGWANIFIAGGADNNALLRAVKIWDKTL